MNALKNIKVPHVFSHKKEKNAKTTVTVPSPEKKSGKVPPRIPPPPQQQTPVKIPPQLPPPPEQKTPGKVLTQVSPPLPLPQQQQQQTPGKVSSQVPEPRQQQPNGKVSDPSNKTTSPPLATFKILLFGESGVGKTSLIRTLTGSPFSHNMLSTIGIDFVKVPFDVDGAKVSLQIWDTAGQERFRSITRFQYRETKGLLLVYDVTSRASFETLSYWINVIENDIDRSSREPVPVILLGNKSDLNTTQVIGYEEGKELANKNFLAGFWETSAATGTNVSRAFQEMANRVVDLYNPEIMNIYKKTAKADVRTVFSDDVLLIKETNNNNNNTNNKNNNRNNNNNNKNGNGSFKSKSSVVKLTRSISSGSHKKKSCQCAKA